MPNNKGRRFFNFRDKRGKIIGCSPVHIKGSCPHRTRHIVITLKPCFYDDNEWPAGSRISVKRNDFLLFNKPPR